MTSRERLHRLYCHEETDRPAVIIRWWGFRDDRSYDNLFRLMLEQSDWVEPWSAGSLAHNPVAPWAREEGRSHTIENSDEAERYSVIDCFPDLGADVFHCFEAPPMGDITPAEAKAALRGKVALEGNIQIADMYEKTPDEIRAQTEALIRDCFDDRRGLAITPTASPFMPRKGDACYRQYATLVETVTKRSGITGA